MQFDEQLGFLLHVNSLGIGITALDFDVDAPTFTDDVDGPGCALEPAAFCDVDGCADRQQ